MPEKFPTISTPAMPVIGSGGRGGAEVIGDLIRVALESTERAAAHHNVDIIIVVRDAAQMGLAQRIRRDRRPSQWSELSANVRRAAGKLSTDCIAGKRRRLARPRGERTRGPVRGRPYPGRQRKYCRRSLIVGHSSLHAEGTDAGTGAGDEVCGARDLGEAGLPVIAFGCDVQAHGDCEKLSLYILSEP